MIRIREKHKSAMGLKKTLTFITISITCLAFSLLVESTHNTPFLTPAPQPSLSPQSQPLRKQSILDVYGDILKKEIELIKKNFPGVKTKKGLESHSTGLYVPKACVETCGKAYISITNSLKKADDLGVTSFKSVNEDYDSFSVDLSTCQQCLNLNRNNGDASQLLSVKAMNNQLKNDALNWLATMQFAGF